MSIDATQADLEPPPERSWLDGVHPETGVSRSERLLEGVADIVTVVDAGGTLLYSSPSFERTLGHEPAAWRGRSAFELLHPDDRRPAREALSALAAAPASQVSLTVRARSRDGAWRELECLAVNRLDDPAIGGIVLSARDATGARAAHERIRLLAAALAAANEGVLLTDRDGRIEWVNPALERLSGYSAEECIGRTSRIFKSGRHDAAFYAELWHTITSGRSWSGELVNRRKDGAMRTEEVSITPVRDDSGAISHFVGIRRDVTAARETEAALRQSQKMESVGRLAGGIAHDFNNLLTVIAGYTELATGRLDASHPAHAPLAEVRKAAERAAELTRQLLTFSRNQPAAARPVDLGRLAASTEGLLRRLLGEKIQFEIVRADPLPAVLADPVQIQQVLMNLAVNARDAMPEGGRFSLKVEPVPAGGDRAATAPFPPGAWVALEVADTGFGMDAPTRARIFEPFFTTKPAGEGTGLGLAIVHGIVSQAGGHIQVESAPGRGSCFRVLLPRCEATAVAEAPAQAPVFENGNETVLLVEDEDAVRRLATELLRRRGYKVLEAANAGEALLASEQHPGPIHLLLSDVRMPRMDGRRLAERIAETRPGIAVLFMSGYSGDILGRSGELDPGVVLLAKPFRAAELLGRVREALDRQRERA